MTCKLVRAILDSGSLRLKNVGLENPRKTAGILFCHALKIKKNELLTREILPSEREIAAYNSFINRVADGEPLEYITRYCQFMGLDFLVDKNVLIPRQDTEVLVEVVIQKCAGKTIKILDVGTGSGCVAASLARFLPDSSAIALDVSPAALDIAAKNFKRLGVSDRIKLIECNFLHEFPQFGHEVDVIVSNPPYIKSGEIARLSPNVKDFEPHLALDGGENGLDFYWRLVDFAKKFSGALLAVEVGVNQAREVVYLMKEKFSRVEIFKDSAGIERVVVGVSA